MKIAIEGCAHGELEKIYNTIALIEQRENFKVDLLICCGDFQSTRNAEDLACMACPPKYRDMCSFYKYYSGEKQAPILTIFIGGNHEASSYLQELSYGGWVAPNIFYLGYAGVVNIGGLRIGGISGIQKGGDYLKGHFEKAPYTEQTKRSCYHIRNLEVFRLKQLSGKIDIMCSHDWPQGVYHHGNAAQLIKHKPYFKQEIEDNKLGSSVCEEVMKQLKPSYWFSAHLHTKFSAVIPHSDGSSTKFLALDKCLPKRRFLQILDLKHNMDEPLTLKYDHEWLTVLFLTNHLLSVKPSNNYLPGPNNSNDRYQFTPTQQELDLIDNKFSSDFTIPLNFTPTAPAFSPLTPKRNPSHQSHSKVHPNTTSFCDKLCIDDPLALVLAQSTPSHNESYSSFQSSTPAGLSTPCRGTSSLVSGASIRKFKLSLPSPKNSSDLEDSTHGEGRINSTSCIVNLDDSTLSMPADSTLSIGDSSLTDTGDVSSTIDEAKLMASVKKFTPYRSKMSSLVSEPELITIESSPSSVKEFTPYKSKMSSLGSEPELITIESPAPSELPRPAFDKSPIEPLSRKNEFEDSPVSSKLSFEDSPLSVSLSQSVFADSPVRALKLPEPAFDHSPLSTKPAFEESPVVKGKSPEKEVETVDEVKPVAKKFKRRNQSIYQTQDDD
uniref:Lariat debranching enzyme n=1 Tax=Cacopsylla melanoneura TaxID=428564 RepID=A0A8D8YS11_9HEMI